MTVYICRECGRFFHPDLKRCPYCRTKVGGQRRRWIKKGRKNDPKDLFFFNWNVSEWVAQQLMEDQQL